MLENDCTIDEAEEMIESFEKYGNKFTGGSCLKYNKTVRKFKQNAQEKAGRIPRGVSIAFVAGKDDPVGNFGKGVREVYKKYKQMGVQDVKIRLYENDRHEILNELDREVVYQDLLMWLDKRCNS